MKHILLISVLIMTVVSIFSPGDSNVPSDDGQILIALEREWNEALKTHDAAWFGLIVKSNSILC